MSLINTVNSITSVSLDTFSPEPAIDGKGSHGGYAGPAIKPIGLHLAAEIARDPGDGRPVAVRNRRHQHVARRGGVHHAGLRQRAGVHRGDGLRLPHRRGDDRGAVALMGDKGYERLSDFQGRAVRNVTDWQHLNLNYTAKARIDHEVCIKCGRCYAACEDMSHQSIAIRDGRVFKVIDAQRVARNLVRYHVFAGGLHHDGVTARRHGGPAHRQGGGRLRELEDTPEQFRGGGRAACVVRRAASTHVPRDRLLWATLAPRRVTTAQWSHY